MCSPWYLVILEYYSWHYRSYVFCFQRCYNKLFCIHGVFTLCLWHLHCISAGRCIIMEVCLKKNKLKVRKQLWTLFRYSDWMRQPALVTLAVLVAWYFSFLIVFVIPLDVSNTIYSNSNCSVPSIPSSIVNTTTTTISTPTASTLSSSTTTSTTTNVTLITSSTSVNESSPEAPLSRGSRSVDPSDECQADETCKRCLTIMVL